MKIVCSHCGEEITDDQPVHGARTNPDTGIGLHWTCYEKQESDFRAAEENIKDVEGRFHAALDELRSKL